VKRKETQRLNIMKFLQPLSPSLCTCLGEEVEESGEILSLGRRDGGMKLF